MVHRTVGAKLVPRPKGDDGCLHCGGVGGEGS